MVTAETVIRRSSKNGDLHHLTKFEPHINGRNLLPRSHDKPQKLWEESIAILIE
jgi:hypothetical protein